MKLHWGLWTTLVLIFGLPVFGADTAHFYKLTAMGKRSFHHIERMERIKNAHENSLASTRDEKKAKKSEEPATESLLEQLINLIAGVGLGIISNDQDPWAPREAGRPDYFDRYADLSVGELLRSAYTYVWVKNPFDKKMARDNVEYFLRSSDQRYREKYSHIKDPIRELALKLILANEAGLFSYWSVLFPEAKVSPDSEAYDLDPFNFPFPEKDPQFFYLDRDYDNCFYVSIEKLLDEDKHPLYSSQQLQKKIVRLRAQETLYEKKLAVWRRSARS